jgi:hypothetical protein
MARDYELTWNSRKYTDRVASNMKRAIGKSCDIVATEAKRNLSVSPEFPGQPSAPGSPPHMQGGLLRSQTLYAIEPDGMSGKVGPLDELEYGRIQELGGQAGAATLPPRPYLKPALDACASRIQKFIRDAMRRSTR